MTMTVLDRALAAAHSARLSSGTRPSVTTDTPRGRGWRQLPDMTMTVLARALAAGDAGRVTGERQERPDPEVPEKARRRTFTAPYKLDVGAEDDAGPPG